MEFAAWFETFRKLSGFREQKQVMEGIYQDLALKGRDKNNNALFFFFVLAQNLGV